MGVLCAFTDNPSVAQELQDSLDRIGCLSNSLHEVIWQRPEQIHHRPADGDIVHGRSLGIMTSDDFRIDVRSFTTTSDQTFNTGHPLYFAEHAVYQSLFEYRNGKIAEAKDRIRAVFQQSSVTDSRHVRWDAENELLIDFVNEQEHLQFLSSETESCRQYTFKLAVLLYACRLMQLDAEYSAQMSSIHRRMLQAQLPSGGIAHFFEVDPRTNQGIPCPDATGEATAIFILAESVKSRPNG